MKRILVLAAILSSVIGFDAYGNGDDGRLDLQGRSAPRNLAAQQARKMKKTSQNDADKLLLAAGNSYPESVGGSVEYEYISSFTVTPTNGYYKVTVKVLCPLLYDADGYPGYGGTYEYVNVWIDWNGDYSWSNSERVMAKSSANYKKILADNRMLYFETTVKDVSTVSGTFNARAMLGYGYNPNDPTTYSWVWGDVKDVPVTFGFDPPTIAAIAIGPDADVTTDETLSNKILLGAKSSSDYWMGADKGVNPAINQYNVVIAGRSNNVSVGIRVKKSDRDKPGFNCKALIFDGKKKLGTYEIPAEPYYTKVENNVTYGYYHVKVPKEFKLSTKQSDYGKKELRVKLDCTNSKVKVSSKEQTYAYYVFYPKDHPVEHKGKNVPMWYKMWSAFVTDLDRFEFSNNIGTHTAGDSLIQPLPISKFQPKENDVAPLYWHYPVYRISSQAAFIYKKKKDGTYEFRGHCTNLKPGISEDKLDYPIDYVVQTVEHEKWHYKLKTENKEVIAKRGKNFLYWAKVGDGDGKVVLDSNGEYEWQDGDLLTASREKDIGTKDENGYTDTFNLAGKIDSDYKSYGDQELYCRLKTQKKDLNSSKYYNKDWSYPGSQLTEWQLNKKPSFESTKKKLALKSNTSEEQDGVMRASSLLSENMGDAIMTYKREFLSADTPDVTFISFADVTEDFNLQGLAIEVGLEHNLEGSQLFTAYLFGTNGVALASAVTAEMFSTEKDKVRFEFSPDTLIKVRELYTGPYVLGRVVCEVSYNPSAGAYSVTNVLTTKDYSTYECKVTTPMVGSMMSDYADEDGLHAVIPITVPAEGMYEITACLASTNGMNLVNAATNCLCAEGRNEIDICFPRDEVFNTKVSGKFLVHDVSVAADGEEPALFVCDYETEQYNYSDFGSGEKNIEIIPGSVELLVKEDDDDPNELYKGVSVRFTVRNSDYDDYNLYRVTAVLADADGCDVAYAEEDVIINGYDTWQDGDTWLYRCSTQTLFFKAHDIKESGKDGPYSVKYLQITDKETGDLIDECAVSAARTVLLSAGNFKGQLTVDADSIELQPMMLGNNKYEGLKVVATVDAPSAGYVKISALVEGEGGAQVGRFESECEVFVGTNTVALVIDGGTIRDSGIDGPYTIREMTASHSSSPETVCGVDKVLETAAYDHMQFASILPVGFDSHYIVVETGENATIRISGGNVENAASAKLYLTYNTASAQDLDLAHGMVDGEVPKGGLKFPLTLEWAAGETCDKTVTIPVKEDAAVETYEMFTLQLASPKGMNLGNGGVFTVTIIDPYYAELEEKVMTGMATADELVIWSQLQTAAVPYIRGLSESLAAGSVTGSGLCADNKKVTLKATANKGFVFAGWYEATSDGEILEDVSSYLAKTASLVIDRSQKPAANTATSTTLTNVYYDVTLYAKFETVEKDIASLQLVVHDAEAQKDGSVLIDLSGACATSISEPKLTVSGLPSGLKFDSKTNTISGKVSVPGEYKVKVSATNASVKKAITKTFTLTVPNLRPELFDYEWLKDNYSAIAGVLEDSTALLGGLGDLINDGWSIKVSGLPTGMSYKAATKTQPMAITGTATKEGDYTMYIEASKKGETTQKATATISVTFPELKVVSENEDRGTVTGGGKYPAGKKVTLKATAKKGCSFIGWYDIYDNPLAVGTDDYRKASYNYETTEEDVTITGKFIEKEIDADELDLVLTGKESIYNVGNTYTQEVSVVSLSLPGAVSVSGLPTGMKFDAKTMKITGAPTKHGELKDVVFTLKNESISGKKVTVRYRVEDKQDSGLELKYNGIPGETGGYKLIDTNVSVSENEELTALGLSLAGWKVSGLPAGIKFDSATGTFSGKATAPGVMYQVTIERGSGANRQWATIVLGTKDKPELKLRVKKVVRDDWDDTWGDPVADLPVDVLFVLKGAGRYMQNAKVTVDVGAVPKNWVFVGWAEYQTEDNETALVLVDATAKYTFNMPEADGNNEVKLVAVFTHVFGWEDEEE